MREALNLFNIGEELLIGLVNQVDTYRVHISTADDRQLRKVYVNGYVILHTADPNSRLIGRIERVVRYEAEADAPWADMSDMEEEVPASNDIAIHALGTLKGPGGGRQRPVFSRAVEHLPEIGAKCFLLLGEHLTSFTGLIADETALSRAPLTLGVYTMTEGALAMIDGNAFFQRHALIVGSTGSGKSWTAAGIIEQAADLPRANMVVFDLHGEYEPLSSHPHIVKYKVAGPADLEHPGDEALFLPYWLLGYEDMLALILDRSDENAPNQAMAFSSAVIKAKQRTLLEADMPEELETFTIDSPVPYRLNDVVTEITALNEEKVPGRNGLINGPFHGKFHRFLPRLAAKRSDRRHGFLFSRHTEQLSVHYLDELVDKLMSASSPKAKGVKIIDFSEVPSDILPIVVSLVARLIFQVQQWSESPTRHPIALVCDEAHLYMPGRSAADASEARALAHFERIAKEGRKYGISLVVISQRPSELNATIRSQCNTIVAHRLANSSDKSAVAQLLPESLGGIQDILPSLDIGEAVVVGDCCLLPSRIKVREPAYKPDSGSVKFWEQWGRKEEEHNLRLAVQNMRRQSRAAVRR